MVSARLDSCTDGQETEDNPETEERQALLKNLQRHLFSKLLGCYIIHPPQSWNHFAPASVHLSHFSCPGYNFDIDQEIFKYNQACVKQSAKGCTKIGCLIETTA